MLRFFHKKTNMLRKKLNTNLIRHYLCLSISRDHYDGRKWPAGLRIGVYHGWQGTKKGWETVKTITTHASRLGVESLDIVRILSGKIGNDQI